MKHLLHNQQGVAIYLTFWVMSLLLGVALGISSMLFTQIGLLRDIGESVLAFAATDAGIERVLYLDTTVCGEIEEIPERVDCLKDAVDAIPPEELVLGNGATYELLVEAEDEGGCPIGVNYCARSLGTYKEARRAVRVAR
ncbi:MAG TPA: hypothetical protein ENI13_01020 [candidate division CPR3 bacterium]|uniref:Uncharacterized protein n=1 Tax=candidate division CPR3 bacterium TaxID=2268181 RepID=A0A7C1SX90_UNCC3|nr:hypothetical protein [candidate division CPR3 bacterium]